MPLWPRADAAAIGVNLFRRAALKRCLGAGSRAWGQMGWSMSETYIIEVASQAAGIVVRDKAGYRFFAASARFGALEGKLFRSAREAEKAARSQAAKEREQAAPL